ncbi:MAG: GEVED domain-containing protein, partial [Flavobacteriaceae bacterium]|nr:GEVED domain-containing protein [Flavobacteriaceae bacterium]
MEENYFNSTAYVHADLRIAKSIDGLFYVGTDGCLAKSEDGGVTWQNLMQINAPPIRENYKLGISQSHNKVAISGSQDNGTSIKKPTEWVEAYGADGMEGIVLPLNPEYMIGSYQFGGRIRTLNAGTSNTIVTSNGTDGWWEAPLAYDPNDQFKIYDFRNGVYVSTDFGLNYNYVGTPSFLSSNLGNYWWQIRNAEIAQNNSDIIIVSRTSEIEKSTDGGISFTNIRNNLPNHMIQDIAINPNDDNDIIVVNASFTDNSEKVFRSINGGASWINITHNIGDIPVHTVVIDHTNNPKIYIGTEVGVYYMPLDGNNWVLYSPDLPNVAIEELEINYGANTLKAATWGRGLWEYDLVDRASYPSIESTSITDPVSLNSPLEESYQYVTSEIIYDGNLTDVKVIFSINNQSFDNSINMSNASGDVWVSDQAIPNSALSGDKVYFKVIATGANNDTSSTYKLMYKVSEFMYCSSVGLTGTTSDFINQVRLGDFVNDSDQNYYTLYDNLEPIELNVGETYELSVRLDYAFNLDNAAVWIDFNRNAIFDDTELITMSQYNNNISNGSFTVPDDVVYGQNLRMRVSNIYDNISDPCGNAYGEVEDYVIIVNNTLDIDNFDENDRTVSVYPNPSSSDIFLKSSENILKVELYDLRGRKIIQQNNLNKFETQFNVEHLKEAI